MSHETEEVSLSMWSHDQNKVSPCKGWEGYDLLYCYDLEAFVIKLFLLIYFFFTLTTQHTNTINTHDAMGGFFSYLIEPLLSYLACKNATPRASS